MTKLNPKGLKALLTKAPGRHSDGDGLFLRVLDPGNRVYWVYRFRIGKRDREMSIGSHPAMTLADARIKHKRLAANVAEGIDPVGERRKANAPKPKSDAKSFGSFSDAYLDRREKRGELGKNPKHRQQWWSTLGKLPAWFRDLPVDEIGPQQVFEALDPIWGATPETGSRLRGRIEMVLDFARKPDDIRANPAAYSGWLKTQLGGKNTKVDRTTGERVKRGNHAAMPYADVPAFVTKLRETPGDAPLALELLILTATRTSETLNARLGEFDLDARMWNIPASRMKTGEDFAIPLSDRAVNIIGAARSRSNASEPEDFLFPGARPKKPLSNMALLMMLRRMKIAATTHGFRTSFRTWASDIAKIEFELAELCLSHRIGSKVSRSYNRTQMTERRAPIMSAWSNFVTGSTVDNVVPINRGVG